MPHLGSPKRCSFRASVSGETIAAASGKATETESERWLAEVAVPLSPAEVATGGHAVPRPPASLSFQRGGDPEVTRAIRLLLGRVMSKLPTYKRIGSWTSRQRDHVRRWATRELLVLQGIETRRLPAPACLLWYLRDDVRNWSGAPPKDGSR